MRLRERIRNLLVVWRENRVGMWILLSVLFGLLIGMLVFAVMAVR